ncbi:MAG TPA: class I SAM-dependent methyltransferase [Alphaproteobacteria bacterium]|nr:class I SAM-dependent methyltransferase [Alphaproteobacteria bacterium]HAJ46725.1 class I SAM-dependent methyltransferase [Alphaproteobacteria bacterium]
MAIDFDNQPDLVANYERGPRWFIPGYDAIHTMAAALLRNRIGQTGRILVLGAGGGFEITAMARHGAWHFTGVDPSEQMLALARRILARDGVPASRFELISGYIPDAPRGAFDAATCFLTMHFVKDDGAKAQAFQHIHACLRPGAPFLFVDGCADMASPNFARQLADYAEFARLQGAPEDIITMALEMNRSSLNFVTAERNLALMSDAGFSDITLFTAGTLFRGWIARA